jgi:hypothetical protein
MLIAKVQDSNSDSLKKKSAAELRSLVLPRGMAKMAGRKHATRMTRADVAASGKSGPAKAKPSKVADAQIAAAPPDIHAIAQ